MMRWKDFPRLVILHINSFLTEFLENILYIKLFLVNFLLQYRIAYMLIIDPFHPVLVCF